MTAMERQIDIAETTRVSPVGEGMPGPGEYPDWRKAIAELRAMLPPGVSLEDDLLELRKAEKARW